MAQREKNQTVGRENKPHIGIYGRCNAGKSTLLNFITQGDFALVDSRAGTTTDPVRKSYEILDFASVIFIDTAGWDDCSELGEKRRAKSRETLMQIDLGLLVYRRWGDCEEELRRGFDREGIPYLLIHNRFSEEASTGGEVGLKVAEALSDEAETREVSAGGDGPGAGALSGNLLRGGQELHAQLLQAIRQALPERSYQPPSMFEGKAVAGEVVLLVCPIDAEAPSGRLILPQVQAIRNLLDQRAVAIVVQPEQIGSVLDRGVLPRLVVTDSQAFAEVKAAVPPGIEITSFSILLAHLKGDYAAYTEGLERVEGLKAGDRVLMLENCLHQSSCEDIGRVKIPRLLERHAGVKLAFTVVSGLSPLPEDLAEYALAVQCGGCMATRGQLQNRIRAIRRAGVPVTNYGMVLNRLS